MTFSRLNSLRGEALISIAGRLLSIAVVIATTKLLANLLGPGEYGRMALFNTCATLSAQFLFGPIGQGLLRFFSIARDTGQYTIYEKTVFDLLKKAVIPSFLLTILSGLFILNGIGWQKWLLLVLIAITAILDGLNGMSYGLQNGARNRALSSALEIIDRLLKILIVGFLLWLISARAELVFAGYLLSGLVMLFLNTHYYQTKIRNSFVNKFSEKSSTDFLIEIKRYSWPFMAFGIFGWMQFSIDRWSLQFFRTEEEVGQYSILFQTGFQTINVAYGIILTFVTPILFDRASVDSSNGAVQYGGGMVQKILLFTLIFTGIGSTFCFCFHEWVIRLLASDEFLAYSYLLPWTVVAGGLFASGQVVSMNFMATLSTRGLIIPKALLGLTNVVGCLIGAKFWGIQGVVLSLVVANAVYLIATLLLDPSKKSVIPQIKSNQ